MEILRRFGGLFSKKGQVAVVGLLFLGAILVYSQTALAQCNNNIVDPDEVCDPPGSFCPNGAVCGAHCNCYSADDCLDAQALGTDSYLNYVNGFIFPGDRGILHTFVVADKEPGAAANLQFNFRALEAQFGGWMDTAGMLRLVQPELSGEFYVTATLGGDINNLCSNIYAVDVSACAALSVPMRSCSTAYGRYFDIDADSDGAFDEMSVVFVDGTAVPLNFRMLFVPLLWTASQADFDAAARQQAELFANSTTLGGCFETVEIVTLDVATQNFATFTCCTNTACSPRSCELGSVTEFVRDLGLSASTFDLIVGLMPGGASPCNPTVGCTNTMDTIWLEDAVEPVLAHEIGHIYNLEDEYCSENVGGDPRCAGASDINFLGADLGCNPAGACCTCNSGAVGVGACSAACDTAVVPDNYHACCEGNDGLAGGGSRCVMSSRGAGIGAQNFCQRCADHLNARPEMACDALPSAPFRELVSVDIDIDVASGSAMLNAAELVRGRATRVDLPGDRYRLRIEHDGTVLLDEEFDLKHYDLDIPPDRVNVRFKAPIDFPIASPPPLLLTLTDEGTTILETTLIGEPPYLTPDADRDRVSDAEDNCPYNFNPYQSNCDANDDSAEGIITEMQGDACDPDLCVGVRDKEITESLWARRPTLNGGYVVQRGNAVLLRLRNVGGQATDEIPPRYTDSEALASIRIAYCRSDVDDCPEDGTLSDVWKDASWERVVGGEGYEEPHLESGRGVIPNVLFEQFPQSIMSIYWIWTRDIQSPQATAKLWLRPVSEDQQWPSTKGNTYTDVLHLSTEELHVPWIPDPSEMPETEPQTWGEWGEYLWGHPSYGGWASPYGGLGYPDRGWENPYTYGGWGTPYGRWENPYTYSGWGTPYGRWENPYTYSGWGTPYGRWENPYTYGGWGTPYGRWENPYTYSGWGTPYGRWENPR